MMKTLGTSISQFPQGSGMRVIGFNRLVLVWFQQVVSKLIFTYSGRDFGTPAFALRFKHLREMGRVIASKQREKCFSH